MKMKSLTPLEGLTDLRITAYRTAEVYTRAQTQAERTAQFPAFPFPDPPAERLNYSPDQRAQHSRLAIDTLTAS